MASSENKEITVRRILYCCVSRGVVILCEYSESEQKENFRKEAFEIFKKPIKPGMLFLQKEQYDILLDKEEETKLIYYIVIEKAFNKGTAYDMIQRMKSRFLAITIPKVVQNAKAFALNPDFAGELRALHVEKHHERHCIQ